MSSPLDKAKAYEVVWERVAPVFEATRHFQNAAYVYVIGEEGDGSVKIGTATNPVKRLRSMQTGNPRRLRIEWVLIGDQSLERMLQGFWEPFAIRSSAARLKVDQAPGTEWFRAEIRSELFPIIGSAVKQQVERVKSAQGDMLFEELDQMVLMAHQEHGFVFKQPDEGRFLAPRGGYQVRKTRGE